MLSEENDSCDSGLDPAFLNFIYHVSLQYWNLAFNILGVAVCREEDCQLEKALSHFVSPV